MARHQAPADWTTGSSVVRADAGRAAGLAVLVRSGIVGPERPDRSVRRLAALARFGPTLAGSFAAAAAHDPDRTAVIDERRRLSYADLQDRVGRIAPGLAGLGAGPTGPVAVLQRNSAAMVEALVAISRLGADTVLLNVAMSAGQIGEILDREQPAALIVDDDLLTDAVQSQVARRPGVALVTDLDQLAEAEAPEPPPSHRRGRFVVLTSGTTGPPKGARRGAPKGIGPAVSMLSRIRLAADEVMLISAPLFHTWGLGMLQLAVAVTGTVVLRRRPDPADLLAVMSEKHCTSLILVPVTAQRLLELPASERADADLSALRVVACSSAPLSADLSSRFQDAFGDVLHNVYGATEVSWATIAGPADLRLAPGSAGRPPPGTTIALLDEAGMPVPLGEIGRIHVGNDLLFEGYTDGGDRGRTGGMIATGDRGLIDEHGLLSVLGREDDLVISGGENVYPSVLEELLVAHAQVREVAVVGVPDSRLGRRLAAYVVLTPDGNLTADDVRELARARLSAFCVPRDVIFLTALPRGATGKVVPRLLPPSP